MSISMKVEIDAATITIVIVNSLKNSNMASITIIPFSSDKSAILLKSILDSLCKRIV